VVEITEESSPRGSCFSEDAVLVKQKVKELELNNFHLSLVLHRNKENDNYLVTAIHDEGLSQSVRKTTTSSFYANSSSSCTRSSFSCSPFSSVFEYTEKVHNWWCEKNARQLPFSVSPSFISVNFEPKRDNSCLPSSFSSLIRYYQDIHLSHVEKVQKEVMQEKNSPERVNPTRFHNVFPVFCGTSLIVALTFLPSCWKRSS
jgi:hypothetical protein